MIRQAVILAAGLGSRLGDKTKDRPKGFVSIGDSGLPMITLSIRKLLAQGVEDIIIGTGAHSDWYDRLASEYHGAIRTVYNPLYATTGSFDTLRGCSPLIWGDFYLLESDLVYDDIGLFALDNCKDKDAILVSGPTGSGDEVYVACDDTGKIRAINKDKSVLGRAKIVGELVGISKLSLSTLGKMIAWGRDHLEESLKADYEDVIARVSCGGKGVKTLLLPHYIWSEVDNESMLERVNTKIYPLIKEAEGTRSVRREVLLNPGPSTTSDSVKRAQVVADICPREREFGDIMVWIASKLTALVAREGDYSTVFFGGSGTAADEAMIASCVPPAPKDSLLVIDNGSYGARMAKIARVYNIPMDVYKSSTYEPIDLKALEETIARGGYSAIAAVYHETTTGLLNPIGDICKIAHRYGLITIVDAVSAYAGIPMDLASLDIDFCSGTSNKHIGGMAGVGFVVCKRALLETQKDYPMRAYYLNLYDQYRYFCENKQTRFTPPVQVLYALRQAIIETNIETVEARYRRFTECWECLLRGIESMGLKMLVAKEHQSHFITAIKTPKVPQYDFTTFHDIARAQGFTIYPGKLGNIDTFRIANMGDIRLHEVEAFVSLMGDYMHFIGVY